MILIVKEPFSNYEKGEAITDPDTVEFILKSDDAQHVIKSAQEE